MQSVIRLLRLLHRNSFSNPLTRTTISSSIRQPRFAVSLAAARSLSWAATHTYRPQIAVHPPSRRRITAEDVTDICFIDPPWPTSSKSCNSKPNITRSLTLPTYFPHQATLHPKHCNGLWLLYSWTNYTGTSLQIVITNPTTGDVDRLPYTRPETKRPRNMMPGFGYVSRTNEYKVASITNVKKGYHSELGVEVLTLGKGETEWRLIPVPPLFADYNDGRPVSPKWVPRYYGCPLLLDEAVHWLLYFYDFCSCGILQFELETETFRVILTPSMDVDTAHYDARHLVEIEGKLGLVFFNQNRLELEIWIWKDLNNEGPSKYCKNIPIKDIPAWKLYTSWRALNIGDNEILISTITHLFLLNLTHSTIELVADELDCRVNHFAMMIKRLFDKDYKGFTWPAYLEQHLDERLLKRSHRTLELVTHKLNFYVNRFAMMIQTLFDNDDKLSRWPPRSTSLDDTRPLDFAIYQESQVRWPRTPVQEST